MVSYLTYVSMHIYSRVRHVDLPIDAHFPNMETVAGLNLYFDGTRVYVVAACSFATFGGSSAPVQILLKISWIKFLRMVPSVSRYLHSEI